MRKTPEIKKLKTKSKPDKYNAAAHAIAVNLVKAGYSPNECTFILVVSLATVLSNCGNIKTVQDVVDRWRRVSEGSEGTVRKIASGVIDAYYQLGGDQ
jgi:hypothetical protein